MLGQKLLTHASCTISDDAHKQYVVVAEEIKKLCELTHMSWDLTASDLFNAVRKVSFVEGAICGAALVGTFIVARKIARLETKRGEE